jgi:hypothetical protein
LREDMRAGRQMARAGYMRHAQVDAESSAVGARLPIAPSLERRSIRLCNWFRVCHRDVTLALGTVRTVVRIGRGRVVPVSQQNRRGGVHNRPWKN